MNDILNKVPSDIQNALRKIVDAENTIDVGKDRLNNAIVDMSLVLTRYFKNSHLVV